VDVWPLLIANTERKPAMTQPRATAAADSHPATPQRLHLFPIFLLFTDLMIAIVIFLGIIGALGALGPLLFG
jgi:hypothetical protein